MGAFEKTSDDFQSNLTLSEATWLNTRKGMWFESTAPSQVWMLLCSWIHVFEGQTLTPAQALPLVGFWRGFRGPKGCLENKRPQPTCIHYFCALGEEHVMASGERFYLLELRHRPAVYGDLGNILKIEGLVIGCHSRFLFRRLLHNFLYLPATHLIVLSLMSEAFSAVIR